MVAIFIPAIPAFIANNKGHGFLIWYIYGFILLPIAFVHSLLLKPNENAEGMKKCEKCASIIPNEAEICPACRHQFTSPDQQELKEVKLTEEFDGDTDVGSVKYQIFLIKKFNIEKNEVLGKYIVEEDALSTLEDALNKAHSLYQDEIKLLEIKRIELNNKISKEREIKNISLEESKRVRNISQTKKRKENLLTLLAVLFAGLAIVAALVIVVVFFGK